MPEPKPNPEVLKAYDQILLKKLFGLNQQRLREHPPLVVAGKVFRNDVLAQAIGEWPYFSVAGLQQVERLLQDKGTLTVGVNQNHKLNLGDAEGLLITGATDAETGCEMSNHVWIRDQAQITRSMLNMWLLGPKKYSQEGELARQLLASGMELMSTPSQLARFQAIIQRSNDHEFISDTHNWPQIFLSYDNLNGEKPEGWNHKQDAWQMQALLFFEAIDAGLIKPKDLKHHPNWQQFLGNIVPFLAAVDFTTQENFGSWEEIAAQKTSVIGIETMLLDKIRQYVQTPGFEFINEYWERQKNNLQENFNKPLKESLETMIEAGIVTVSHGLPNESSVYFQNDTPTERIKGRTADVALLYLLDYGFGKMTQKRAQKESVPYSLIERNRVEDTLLSTVRCLVDRRTGAIRRYGATAGEPRDSYEGPNFYTNEAQEKLRVMYQQAPSDKSGQEYFIGRDKIIPAGESASWTHPVAQLGIIYAQRYLETGYERDYIEARNMFVNMLSFVTGEDEHCAKPNKDCVYDAAVVPAWKMPECLITWQYYFPCFGKVNFISPSLNTPLNWATAKTAELMAYMIKCAEKRVIS